MLAAVRRILSDPDDARDAFQEGMLSAWKSLPNYQGRASLATWVHRIVVNHALMRLRRKRRTEEQSLDALLPAFTDYGHYRSSPPSWSLEPAALLERAETRALVKECIDKLPDSYRVPLLLRDVEGMDVDVVAQMLGISGNAVKIRAHRARQALKTLLEPHLLEGRR